MPLHKRKVPRFVACFFQSLYDFEGGHVILFGPSKCARALNSKFSKLIYHFTATFTPSLLRGLNDLRCISYKLFPISPLFCKNCLVLTARYLLSLSSDVLFPLLALALKGILMLYLGPEATLSWIVVVVSY